MPVLLQLQKRLFRIGLHWPKGIYESHSNRGLGRVECYGLTGLMAGGKLVI